MYFDNRPALNLTREELGYSSSVPFGCRKTWQNGLIFQMRPQSDIPCHSRCRTIKDPPHPKGNKCRATVEAPEYSLVKISDWYHFWGSFDHQNSKVVFGYTCILFISANQNPPLRARTIHDSMKTRQIIPNLKFIMQCTISIRWKFGQKHVDAPNMLSPYLRISLGL